MYRTFALMPLVLALSCGVVGNSDQWGPDGKEVLEPTGHVDSSDEKADGALGRVGPSVDFDDSDNRVWHVTRAWSETDNAPGMAWPSQSGLNWDEKFSAWIDTFELVGPTFQFTTPFGKTVESPNLDCAELSMFFRIAFANWYGLPFFMEAHANGRRIFFGHMGIIEADGTPWRGLPSSYVPFSHHLDYRSMEAIVTADLERWPRVSKLRNTSILGVEPDGQAFYDGAPAGTYFDEVFLNKRVGYFLTMHLYHLGTVNLADSANTFNVRADAVSTGDFLIKRLPGVNVGHAAIVGGLYELGETEVVDGVEYPQIGAVTLNGTLPRKQAHWDFSNAARDLFIGEEYGGRSTVALGAGLKRFRSAVRVGGRWANSVSPYDRSEWINSTDYEALVDRLKVFENMLGKLSPRERVDALVRQIDTARENLRTHPSSCANRTKREDAFRSLYQVAQSLDMDKAAVDQEYRLLEDYVFAELEYRSSKTCCWNSSTPAMAEAILKFNECYVGESTDSECDALDSLSNSCQQPLVFMNRDDGGDGYEVFEAFARANGYSWNEYENSERCSQGNVAADTLGRSVAIDFCGLEDDSFWPGIFDL